MEGRGSGVQNQGPELGAYVHALATGDGKLDRIGSPFLAAAAVAVTGDTSAARLSSHFQPWPDLLRGFGCLVGAVGRSGGVVLQCQFGITSTPAGLRV